MKRSHCNSFEDQASVDEICGCMIFKWVAVSWSKTRHRVVGHAWLPGLTWPLQVYGHMLKNITKTTSVITEKYVYIYIYIFIYTLPYDITMAKPIPKTKTVSSCFLYKWWNCVNRIDMLICVKKICIFKLIDYPCATSIVVHMKYWYFANSNANKYIPFHLCNIRHDVTYLKSTEIRTFSSILVVVMLSAFGDKYRIDIQCSVCGES